MSDKQALWTLASETMQAFGPFYREAMRNAAEEADLPANWFGLSLARGSDPAPFTVDRFQEMAPYGKRDRLVETLEALEQLELLERVGDDAYRLTGTGREAVESIFDAAHEGIGTVDPLPAGEQDRLNDLLRRIVEGTLASPEPPYKWALLYSRWTDPGDDGPGAAKTDQYLTDLARYRDDAHIGAWQPLGVSGYAWEALTFIWREEGSTAEALADRFGPYRGYTAEEYQKALGDLVARGWVMEKDGAYKLTEKGREVREQAEEETDRLFFIGWSALNESEHAELQDLLTRAGDHLRAATLDQLYNLLGEVSQGIGANTRDVVGPRIAEQGLDQPGFFFALMSALRFEPDPVSAARMAYQGPYGNPAQYDNVLTALADRGFLTARGRGEYVITDQGRTAWQTLNHAFYTRLGELAVLSEEDLARAEGFLNQIVEASLKAPEIVGNGGITRMHRIHPKHEYAPLARIDQHLDDLNAFRDDVHLAAWRPYNVGGHAWEAFTFVWRGDARTAEELAEKLPFRGHSAAIYAGALANLATRGWVEGTAEEGYQVTEQGRTVRQQAEDATNRYYFAPWAGLSHAEQMQLHDLLTRLRNDLRRLAEGAAG